MVKFPALNNDDKFNPFFPVKKIGITFNPFCTCKILVINLTLSLHVKLGNIFNPFAPSEMMVKFPALNNEDKFNPFLPVEKIGVLHLTHSPLVNY